MSERHTSTAEKVKPAKLDAKTMSDEQLAALNEAYQSVDKDSRTPMADLRSALSESDAFSFKDIYEMNNIELRRSAEVASGTLAERQKEARAAELTATLDAVEGKHSYADKRAALSELHGFKKIHDMDNLDIDAFIADTKQELNELNESAEEATEVDESIDTPRAEVIQDGDSSTEGAELAPRIELKADKEVELAPRIEDETEVASEKTEINESVDPTEKHRQSRLKRAWASFSKTFDRASHELGMILTGAASELSKKKRGSRKEGESQEEYEKRQKKYGRRVILGMVAVAGTALAVKFASEVDVDMPWEDGGNGETVDNQNGNTQSSGNGIGEKPEPQLDSDLNRNELFDGRGSSREFSREGLNDFKDWVNGYEVESGDTIWDDMAADYLKHEGIKNPTVPEIDAAKDKILPVMQKLGYASENGWLNTGDTIRIK